VRGNAVNPLTSLAIPFEIPVLLIVTWRPYTRRCSAKGSCSTPVSSGFIE